MRAAVGESCYPALQHCYRLLAASYDMVLKGAALVQEQVNLQGGIPVNFGNDSTALNITYINLGPVATSTNVSAILDSLDRLIPR